MAHCEFKEQKLLIILEKGKHLVIRDMSCFLFCIHLCSLNQAKLLITQLLVRIFSWTLNAKIFHSFRLYIQLPPCIVIFLLFNATLVLGIWA